MREIGIFAIAATLLWPNVYSFALLAGVSASDVENGAVIIAALIVIISVLFLYASPFTPPPPHPRRRRLRKRVLLAAATAAAFTALAASTTATVRFDASFYSLAAAVLAIAFACFIIFTVAKMDGGRYRRWVLAAYAVEAVAITGALKVASTSALGVAFVDGTRLMWGPLIAAVGVLLILHILRTALKSAPQA